MQNRCKPFRFMTYGSAIILWLALTSFQASGNIRAYLNYVTFFSPEHGPYIEIYMSIDGGSVNFKPVNGESVQAEIEVTMIFRQGEKIADFDKYILRSNEIQRSDQEKINILDQQRYFLQEGKYDFEITLKDLLSDEDPLSILQKIEISFAKDQVALSGIQLVDTMSQASETNILTKSGYDILPRVHNYYPGDVNKLRFYSEIYNTDEQFGPDDRFLVRCMISSFESEQVLDEYVSQRILEPKKVIPYLNEFEISDLPTGYYLLGIELRDRSNEIVTSNALFFERKNPGAGFGIGKLEYYDISTTFASKITHQDTLNEYLLSLEPRANRMEQKFIFDLVGRDNLILKQKFFYYFWYSRNRENPETEWNNYKDLVTVVNERYSTQIAKGYETDRGRVYLKYGPPNIISESYNEPSSYPYEIWHYYKLGKNQSNKKFVFFTQDIITNDFWLLHSDAIGEISNYRWQMILNQRWYDPHNIDLTRPPDIWGSKADDYYRNPR